MFKAVIIDDDPIIRKGLRRTIAWENYGFQVAGEAGDGESGCALIEEVRPDLIVTDIRMPGLSGFEMLEKSAKACPGCEIIVITAFRNFEYARSALTFGARDILLKPARIEEIISAVIRAGEALTAREAKRNEEKRLRELFERNLPVLREKFLHALVFGLEIWREGCAERLSLFRIDWTGFYVLTVRFHFSPSPDIRTYERYLRQLSVASILEISLGLDFDVVNIGIRDDQLTLLLGLHPVPGSVSGTPVSGSSGGREATESTEDGVLRTLREACEQTIATVKASFGLPLTMALSARHEGLQSLRAAYEEASVALELSFYTGPELVLEYDGSRLRGGMKAAPCRIGTDDLLFSVRAGNTEQVKKWLEKPGTDCREGERISAVKGQFLDILIQLEEAGRAVGFAEPDHEERLSLFAGLQECRTLQELKTMIAERAMAIAVAVRECRLQGIEKAVESAKKIISEEYANQFSLQDVADRVFVSASYLSRIFKRVTDMNFIEYVNVIRIEAAKKWLIETDLLAYQVADRVGFQDAHYFSRIFKKVTGLTPLEYREGHAGAS